MSHRAKGLMVAAGFALALMFVVVRALEDINQPGVVMVLSVSSDGQYALSSHSDRRLVLWNLGNQTAETLSTSANIYSAHIPPDSDLLLWQELDGRVIAQRLTGERIREFKSFPSYGHMMTPDGAVYVASDERWRLYRVNEDESVDPIKTDGDSPSFIGTGKLLNLHQHVGEGLLLSVGRGLRERDRRPLTDPLVQQSPAGFSEFVGVVLWDLETRAPVHKLPGNSNKTHAVFSPDGAYVVSVDENGKSYVWYTKTGQRAYEVAWNYILGKFVEDSENPDEGEWSTDGAYLTYPDDFPEGFSGGSMVAVQFISETEYLTFYTYRQYAALYELGDPFAHAIFDLGNDPFPSVSSYARNASIATAPAAHVLVTGQRSGGGINVYRYDPESRTLELDWAWRDPPWWWPFGRR